MPPHPNLTNETFDYELMSITYLFSAMYQGMGPGRWDNRDGLHLTAPGWRELGVIHHDMQHSDLELSSTQRAAVYDIIAKIDWSRTNEKWATMAQLWLM